VRGKRGEPSASSFFGEDEGLKGQEREKRRVWPPRLSSKILHCEEGGKRGEGKAGGG